MRSDLNRSSTPMIFMFQTTYFRQSKKNMNKYCPKLEVFMIEGSDFKQGGEVLSWAFCVSGFHFTQQKMVLPIVTTWKITY